MPNGEHQCKYHMWQAHVVILCILATHLNNWVSVWEFKRFVSYSLSVSLSISIYIYCQMLSTQAATIAQMGVVSFHLDGAYVPRIANLKWQVACGKWQLFSWKHQSAWSDCCLLRLHCNLLYSLDAIKCLISFALIRALISVAYFQALPHYVFAMQTRHSTCCCELGKWRWQWEQLTSLPAFLPSFPPLAISVSSQALLTPLLLAFGFIKNPVRQ